MAENRRTRLVLSIGAALVIVTASTGCVDRLIRDFGEYAEGGGGQVATESDGVGETDQISSGSTTMDEPPTSCEVPSDCAASQTCFEGVCVGTGTVRISLSWEPVTDLDLHVFVPNGDWMSFENPLTAYGELDVDDCVAGVCINQDGTHVENIFLHSNAPRGTFGIRVINFDGRRDSDYSIEVAGAVSASFVGYVPSESYAEGPLHEIAW